MKTRLAASAGGFGIILFCLLFFGVHSIITKNPPIVVREIQNPNQLRILWAEWIPADLLQTLAIDFTEETGVNVEIIQESWGSWQEIFFQEMDRKGTRYDMVIGDSQWLGRGSTGGHYVELTKWMNKHGVVQSMTESSISGYAEYPKNSGHYWAVPLEGDAMGFSYRKDLFEKEEERRNFKSKYGYELAVPETWEQLYDIAEFFYRPKADFYGVLAWVEPEYDGLTMGVQSLIWAWGGFLGNQVNHQVQGLLNNDNGIEAVKFYKKLNQFNNPIWRYHYLDTKKNSNIPMMQGKVAMAMGYFAINNILLDPKKNPYAESMGFFANPKGPKARVCSLGGQGISIISYTKKKDLCFSFLEWLIRYDTQKKWADLGGLSCHKTVLESEEFQRASPINLPYKQSIEMARDFWTVPEYPLLLEISQKYLDEYIQDKGNDAQNTMDTIASEWENIFEKYGYYKE